MHEARSIQRVQTKTPEELFECPACLGIKMSKLRLSPNLTLDACQRCGGVWFEAGEITALRQYDPAVLWAVLKQRPVAAASSYHEHTLACPVCDNHLKRNTKLRLDACKDCLGVWFDHASLKRVWQEQLDLVRTQQGDSIAMLLLEEALEDPRRTLQLGSAAAHLGVEVLRHAPDLAEATLEHGTELASGVFDAIAEMIKSIFD